jgi:acyl-CoA synthetase (AMP-forming)/AMP-acid ligase II
MPHATPFLPAKICLDPPSPQSSEIRTLPELLEYNSRHNPEHLFCLQAKKRDKNVPYELISVTHLQLKRAVLQCSNWIVSNIPELELPRRQEDGEVVKGRPVALFMESDVGLVIQLLSLLSLGIPVSSVEFMGS